MAMIPSSINLEHSLNQKLIICSSPMLHSHSFSRCLHHTQTRLSRLRKSVQKVSLKYTFNKQSPHCFAALDFHGAQNSTFSIQRIHAAVVLAAAGHSCVTSGEVSLGNGLQKGVWELNSDEQWKLWSAREQL